MKRKCFYSFHYVPDHWRASMVRQIGSIEGNEPASDNDWESISSGADKDEKIERWIKSQMAGRSCAVILVGAKTANRKWINYEIVKAWDQGLGVVAIRIHGLKHSDGGTAAYGENPLDYITHGRTGRKLSSVARCLDPTGADSKAVYSWISGNIASAIEDAIQIRQKD